MSARSSVTGPAADRRSRAIAMAGAPVDGQLVPLGALLSAPDARAPSTPSARTHRTATLIRPTAAGLGPANQGPPSTRWLNRVPHGRRARQRAELPVAPREYGGPVTSINLGGAYRYKEPSFDWSWPATWRFRPPQRPSPSVAGPAPRGHRRQHVARSSRCLQARL